MNEFLQIRLGDIKFYYMDSCISSVTAQIDKEMIGGIHRFIKYLDSIQGIKVQQVSYTIKYINIFLILFIYFLLLFIN